MLDKNPNGEERNTDITRNRICAEARNPIISRLLQESGDELLRNEETRSREATLCNVYAAFMTSMFACFWNMYVIISLFL